MARRLSNMERLQLDCGCRGKTIVGYPDVRKGTPGLSKDDRNSRVQVCCACRQRCRIPYQLARQPSRTLARGSPAIFTLRRSSFGLLCVYEARWTLKWSLERRAKDGFADSQKALDGEY